MVSNDNSQPHYPPTGGPPPPSGPPLPLPHYPRLMPFYGPPPVPPMVLMPPMPPMPPMLPMLPYDGPPMPPGPSYGPPPPPLCCPPLLPFYGPPPALPIPPVPPRGPPPVAYCPDVTREDATESTGGRVVPWVRVVHRRRFHLTVDERVEKAVQRRCVDIASKRGILVPKYTDILGMEWPEFRAKLRKQVDARGFEWDSYAEQWNIDHILPVNKCNFKFTFEWYACFHHSNIQPLTKKENSEKGDTCSESEKARLTGAFEREYWPDIKRQLQDRGRFSYFTSDLHRSDLVI